MYFTLHPPFSTQPPDCQAVAVEMSSKVEAFRPHVPLIQGLRNPGMKMRHWQLLSDSLGMNVNPKVALSFSRCLEIGLQNHAEEIAEVAEVAAKEYAIEQVWEGPQEDGGGGGASAESNPMNWIRGYQLFLALMGV